MGHRVLLDFMAWCCLWLTGHTYAETSGAPCFGPRDIVQQSVANEIDKKFFSLFSDQMFH